MVPSFLAITFQVISTFCPGEKKNILQVLVQFLHQKADAKDILRLQEHKSSKTFSQHNIEISYFLTF